MKNRTLGKTGLQVSPLALGGLFVSSVGADFENGKKAILRAVERGINYADTAPGYANSEEVLGRVLAGVESPLILSTKLGGRPQPFDPKNKSGLRRSNKALWHGVTITKSRRGLGGSARRAANNFGRFTVLWTRSKCRSPNWRCVSCCPTPTCRAF